MSTKSNIYTMLYKCNDQHRTIKNSKMAHPTKHTDELYMSKLLNSSEKHRFSHFFKSGPNSDPLGETAGYKLHTTVKGYRGFNTSI